ncbi:MAG: phosphate ABC transporter permease PstA [Chloroflexi bacterium]|nr:phosphate ABC transporter permease PstA [Chloroflexota bacterium]
MSLSRRLSDALVWALCGLALLLVIIPTVDIIVGIVVQSAPSWSWKLLTTPTHGVAGGLQNAILGTIVLIVGTVVVAGFVGVLGGIYLAELSGQRTGALLRFFSEVLAGIPSIVIGYVGYVALVITLGWGFSMLAGVLALSIMIMPYIMKTTEASFRQIPNTYREAYVALGLPRVVGLQKVLLPPAIPGVLTGLVVALAIAMGETAPLIYTAGWTNALPPHQLTHQPIAYLTYVVWAYTNQPFAQSHALANSAALSLIILLLVLILASRLMSWQSRRFTTRMQA